MKRKIHDKPELKAHRKNLRKNLTSAEAFLWSHLQQKKLEGRKFRRQHSIENYIVDIHTYLYLHWLYIINITLS